MDSLFGFLPVFEWQSHKDHCPHSHCFNWWILVSKCCVGVSRFYFKFISKGKRLLGDSISRLFTAQIIFESIWFLLDWYWHRLHIESCERRNAKHRKIIPVRAPLIAFIACSTTYLCLLFRLIYWHQKIEDKNAQLLFIFLFPREIHFPSSSESLTVNRFSPSFIDRRVAAITDRHCIIFIFAHKNGWTKCVLIVLLKI